MTGLYAIFLFMIGASLTSFFGVVGSRVPRGESINGRSHCDACQREIPAYALIPILGYIMARGRCGHCKQRVSIQYPLFETLGGSLFALSYLIAPTFDVSLFSMLVFISVMLIGLFSTLGSESLPQSVWYGGLVLLGLMQLIEPVFMQWDSIVALGLVIVLVVIWQKHQVKQAIVSHPLKPFVQSSALCLLFLGGLYGLIAVMMSAFLIVILNRIFPHVNIRLTSLISLGIISYAIRMVIVLAL